MPNQAQKKQVTKKVQVDATAYLGAKAFDNRKVQQEADKKLAPLLKRF